MIRRVALALAVVAMAFVASPAIAVVAPGDKAPELKGLQGTDGKTYSSADLKDKKATVVVFTCNSCPVAVAYEDRFNEFAKKYQDKGVAFVAINANKATEDLDEMKQRAKEKGFAFPYVYDETGKSASEFGARVTPHLFVLDGQGTVQYVGAFDDRQNNPSKHYVADAVDAILAGKKPGTAQTRPIGCGIRNK
jgi:peroxiredoxin